MFSVEAFENSLYEEAGDPGGGGGGGGHNTNGEVWEWSTAAVPRKPFTVPGLLPDTTGSSYTDVVYPWLVANEQLQLATMHHHQQHHHQHQQQQQQQDSQNSSASASAPMLMDVPSAGDLQKQAAAGAMVAYHDDQLMQLTDVVNLQPGVGGGCMDSQQQSQLMDSPMLPSRSLAAVKKIGYKSSCSAKRKPTNITTRSNCSQQPTAAQQPPPPSAASMRKTSMAAASSMHWAAICACGSGNAAGCICGQNTGQLDYYGCGNSICESNGLCTGLCTSSMLQRNSPIIDPAAGGSSSSSAGTTSLSRFTLQDENGKRKIRNDIMSIAESLPSLPGLYFDKKQKGFRVRYQNVYVGWVALSRFPSIEEAYCSARDIWENAKAHAEKFQTPQAAIIASLPLQKQAKASGKNRGGRPRTVTQLPPEWGPGSNNGGNHPSGCSGGSNGSAYADSALPPPPMGNRRMTSWGQSNTQLIANSMTGELTAAPSPTDHWSHQQMSSADMMYPASKFNELAIFAGGGNPSGVLTDNSEPAAYYLPSPISYGKPVVTDDLNFDSTPWS